MHIGHQKVLIQPLKRCRCPTAAAGYDRSTQFTGNLRLVHTEKEAVEERREPTVGASIIDRRTDHKAASVQPYSFGLPLMRRILLICYTSIIRGFCHFSHIVHQLDRAGAFSRIILSRYATKCSVVSTPSFWISSARSSTVLGSGRSRLC